MLAHASAWIAPRIAVSPPAVENGLILAGEFSRASGLGESARLMLRALTTLGIPVWPLDIGPMLPMHTRDQPAPFETREYPAGAALLLHVNAPLLPLVLARLPRGTTIGRRIVGVWAWELPVAAPEWRPGARFVHEVWAPSRFAANALGPLVSNRVRVVPLPVADAPPEPSTLSRADFSLPEGAVVVLVCFNLASSFERKNPLGAIAAFRAAFGDRPDRLLVLKLTNPEHFPDDFARLATAVAGTSNIRLETRTMPRTDTFALIAASDIVLSLHRSEGFGLVPAEAMMLGKPVIATGWSGNMDFMDDRSAALVRHLLVEVQDARGVYSIPGASWAEPDIAQAAEWLVRLADNAEARLALGRAGQAKARACLGTDGLARAIRALGGAPA
jgi:glycosyltransferase involved in cell wall biosynthesis